MAQAGVMMRLCQQEHLCTPGKASAAPQVDTSLITSARKRKDSGDTPYLQPVLLGEEGKRQRTPPAHCMTQQCVNEAVVQLVVTPHKSSYLASSQGAPEACEQHAVAGAELQWEGDGGDGQPSLFSPHFHLHREGDGPEDAGGIGACEAVTLEAAGAAAAQHSSGAALSLPVASPATCEELPCNVVAEPQGTVDADRTSTDHSTGTSASLDGSASEASEFGEAASGEGSAIAVAACAAAAAVPAPRPSPPPSESCPEDECDVEDCLEFDPLLFIKRLPPLERCVAPRREFLLPKKTRRSKQKTLVLDLDETLVHSTLDAYCRPDFTFPVEVGAMRHMVSVRQRPHLRLFLERCAQLYEVVVFTASQRVYAEQLLNIVDPERRLVRHRVFRESCVLWEGNYLKDLTVLGRDLAHTLIVDNSPQAFGFQLDNGVPIESWYDDDADTELLKLLPFLEQVAGAEDVRPHIQKRYRLRSLVEAAVDPAEGPQLHTMGSGLTTY